MQNSVEVFKKIIIFVILAKMMSSHRASGFISNTSRPISCQGSAATIDFDFDLQGDSIASGSKVWYFSRILIGQDTGSGFTALGNYSGRLTNHLSHGLTLNNVTTADKGTYEYEIFLDTALAARTATASLTVYIGPLAPSASSGCLVYANQSGNTVTCNISGNCGTPPLNPFWVNFTTQSNQFECTVGGTYQCCATSSASASCYSGSSNDFCTLFNCTPVTTTTTTTTTDAMCEPGGAVFIILDISIIISYTIMVILIIDLIIFYKTSTISIFMACLKTGHRCLCILYIVLVIIVVVCEIVTIIMIIIGRECDLILVVGLVLDLIIITVTIIFVIVFIKTGVIICNKDTVRNPRTRSDVKITAYIRTIFFSDLKWIGPKGNTLSTDGKYIIDQYDSNTGKTSLTITNVSQDDDGLYICQAKIGCIIAKDSVNIMCADKEMKTKNSGSSSALSRKDVELQMAKKDGMSDEEERPPVIHIGTQNKTEPKTTSKQTNERPQPLPPVGGVAEDKLKPRPPPPRPENIDAKDRNLRGLSANYDDTQGLASGTPQPKKLPPLTLKQETVQEEDASEEKMKKKRKKKKKKGQMNEENQAEEMEELKSQRTSSED